MTAITTTTTTPFLVVFGRDKGGKPHASWFDQASADLARKAAVLMEMHAVPVESDPLRELASTLPRGRVFASGKAFTPFINGKLYERLTELTREVLGLGPAEAIRVAEDAKATASSEEPPGPSAEQAGGTRPAQQGEPAKPNPGRREARTSASAVLCWPRRDPKRAGGKLK